MAKIKAIKENYLFSKLYAKGKRVVTKNVTVYALFNYKSADTRLGITASKKLGGAVQRTRARRLIREAFRLIQAERPFARPFLIVAVARGALFAKERKMGEVKEDLTIAFTKLGLFNRQKP